jgi:hypothetical protein
MLFSFRDFGPLTGPSSSKFYEGQQALLTAALAQKAVSIPAIGTEGDDESTEASSSNALHFLGIQFARARAGEYTVAVIHKFSPFVILVR